MQHEAFVADVRLVAKGPPVGVSFLGFPVNVVIGEAIGVTHSDDGVAEEAGSLEVGQHRRLLLGRSEVG
ncbi:hypothetical protein AGR8A_Cc30600 [Agrobacterium fabrum str. J-07]|nr:hypothetical protein AGR8A_Cc30600 [Agrobacterium fabrum str. J-07]